MSRKIRFSKESQSSLNDFFVHRSPEQPKSKEKENLPAGILSAFRTDVGKVRANNQDAPIVSEKLRLYGVADGMGGHKGGEVASTSARDDLLRELEGKTPSVATLSGAIEEVNRQIYHQQEHDDALTGMGTTLSVLWMSDNFVYIGHVGDSRVYLLRDGEFKQMTLDHSLVEQLVREGVLTEEEAQNHPMRNIITRAIGTDESVEVDVVVEERRKGDRRDGYGKNRYDERQDNGRDQHGKNRRNDRYGKGDKFDKRDRAGYSRNDDFGSRRHNAGRDFERSDSRDFERPRKPRRNERSHEDYGFSYDERSHDGRRQSMRNTRQGEGGKRIHRKNENRIVRDERSEGAKRHERRMIAKYGNTEGPNRRHSKKNRHNAPFRMKSGRR